MPPVTRSTGATANNLSDEVLPDKIKPVKLDKPLPVTVLSGFLGSGKTTLLRNILTSQTHKLKIAVIVNDMASINIDGATISRLSPSHSAGKTVVQMQNGCICCTLRGDLLAELAKLAWSKSFDYVVVESSGISEPQQVAETFSVELSERMVLVEDEEGGEGMSREDREVLEEVAKQGGLSQICTLDTMVTVVDVFRFFAEFSTHEFLTDRYTSSSTGEAEAETASTTTPTQGQRTKTKPNNSEQDTIVVPAEDQRTISDLFADQLEFANVILLNKLDMVDGPTLDRVRAYVRALNPHAKILEGKYGRVDVRELLNTGAFNWGDAVAMTGWLVSLKEMAVRQLAGEGGKRVAPKPETLEYGIGSFVYTARRPFDPLKLYKAIEGMFILLQEEYESEEEDDDDEEEDDEEGSEVDESKDQLFNPRKSLKRKLSSTSSSSSSTHAASLEEDQDQDRAIHSSPATTSCSSSSDKPNSPTSPSSSSNNKNNKTNDRNDPHHILATKASSHLFRGLHRSKGTLWLSTRPSQMGLWSSAGAMLTVTSQAPWFCTLPEEAWQSPNEATTAAIRADFEGEWGDRRQEIVLIGEDLDRDGLRAWFDACLLGDEEMRRWERVMRHKRLSEERKEERLGEMWDDGYWAEWRVDEEEHDHDHDHDHSHKV